MRIYAASYLLPISSPPIAGGAIAVENGEIVAVGSAAELSRAINAPVIDFPGCVIMPGFVNAHTHLELTHFPAWKIRKELDYLPKRYVEWIQQIVKIRRSLLPGELELSVREGLRLCLESGSTALGEILTDFSLAPLYAASPLLGRIYLELIGHDPIQCDLLLERMEQVIPTVEGRFLPGISPHTPHTVSAQMLKQAQNLSVRHALPKAIHLSETLEEVSFMHDTTGDFAEFLYPMARWEQYLPHPMRTTSTGYLDDLGVLDGRTLAIHAVHVTPADAAILKERGVTVALCPRSNDRLFVGSAPHRVLKSAGIPLAVGTDSLASNDSLSILDEIRFLRELAPADFRAEELFTMATLNGARGLGIETRTGSLDVGKRGDFLVLSGCPANSRSPYEALLEKGKLEQVYLAGEVPPES